MFHRNKIPRKERLKHSALWLCEHLFSPEPLNRVFREARERKIQDIEALLRAQDTGRIIPVDQVTQPSRDEFHRQYLLPSVPVVFKGLAKSWPAFGKWAPSFFGDCYGDSQIQIIHAAVEDVNAPGGYKPKGDTISFREVIKGIETGSKIYPRFAPLLHEHPELMEDFDHAWLKSLCDSLRQDLYYQFFMGAAGTNTGLHNAVASNFFVQLYGKKRWRIFEARYAPVFRPLMMRSTYFMSEVDILSPSFDDDPVFNKLNGYEVVLEPGDVLYNPPFFWHQVYNETTTIGVGVRWFGLKSILNTSLTQGLLTLTASNPPLWVAYKNRKNFTRTFISSTPTPKG